MSTYPRERIQFLQWCEARWPVWAKDPEAIGLTAQQITAVKNATQAMRARVTEQTAARAAAKSATEAVVDAEGTTRDEVADAVRFIRAYATSTNDPNVYNLAQIPAPGSAAPVPPPGTPTDFRVELNAEGSITIRWKAAHPEGSYNVVYFVQRKLLTETQFRIIGGSGERAYTDETLPFGVDGATYIVTSQRGSVQSAPSRQLTITFGSGGGRGGVVQYTEKGSRAAA